MRCNIRSVNCTLRSVRPLTINIRSVKSTLRSVRPLNDPYGSNELNKRLTDRYDAGVLDNPPVNHSKEFVNEDGDNTNKIEDH